MPLTLTFPKTGKEIKGAIHHRTAQLMSRLDKRNSDLDSFMENKEKLHSYLVRATQFDFSHGGGRTSSVLHGKEDISSEEKQETQQLCNRIFELEQEIHQLKLINTHLNDKQTFDLSFSDLVQYGFETESDIEYKS